MMPGHGANSTLFNKKKKIGPPEHSLTPTPLLWKPLSACKTMGA